MHSLFARFPRQYGKLNIYLDKYFESKNFTAWNKIMKFWKLLCFEMITLGHAVLVGIFK